MNESIGARIRQLRLRKFGPQREIAKLLDISIPGYYKIEAGITDINLSRLIQIAAILEVKPGALIADDLDVIDLKAEVLQLKEKLDKSQAYTIELQERLITAYELLAALREKCGEHGGVLDLLR